MKEGVQQDFSPATLVEEVPKCKCDLLKSVKAQMMPQFARARAKYESTPDGRVPAALRHVVLPTSVDILHIVSLELHAIIERFVQNW